MQSTLRLACKNEKDRSINGQHAAACTDHRLLGHCCTWACVAPGALGTAESTGVVPAACAASLLRHWACSSKASSGITRSSSLASHLKAQARLHVGCGMTVHGLRFGELAGLVHVPQPAWFCQALTRPRQAILHLLLTLWRAEQLSPNRKLQTLLEQYISHSCKNCSSAWQSSGDGVWTSTPMSQEWWTNGACRTRQAMKPVPAAKWCVGVNNI